MRITHNILIRLLRNMNRYYTRVCNTVLYEFNIVIYCNIQYHEVQNYFIPTRIINHSY